MKINVFSLIFYFIGSILGILLAVFFVWFGDFEQLSLQWPFLSSITDEWSLLLLLLLFSFAVYCFLNLQYELKRFNKPKLDWWQKGVIYQVYPKSFKDTNGDGIGDLGGITEKIDYLKSLGVDIVYMNPIYPHADKDNGYDVTSFFDISKEFGTMKDFENLVSKLHKNGMHIVMDFIPNHTSHKHEWFVKSSESDSTNNPYRDYYVWYPSNDRKNPPNNWVPIIGKSAWTYHDTRKAWYYHTFLPEQPDLNFRCPQVREEVKKVLKFWLQNKKVDGMRIDAIKHLFEDPSFKDEPKSNKTYEADPNHLFETLDHIYTLNQPETFEILAEWRAVVDEIGRETKKSKLLFVESYGTPEEQATYFNYQSKPAAHFPLNFQLLNLCENKRICLSNIRVITPFSPQTIKTLIDPWHKCKKVKYFWSNWELGNHDCTRVGTRIGKENVNLANALCLLLGGTAITYYGEEIGMENLDYDSISYEQCQDDFALSFGPDGYKKYNRDYCRSPMQWDDSPNAGFTNADKKTWLPVHPNYKTVNVKNQLDDPTSPLRVYIELVKLRQKASFQWGDFQYAIVDEHIFSFVRSAFDEESFLVAMNLSDQDVTINFLVTRLMPSTITTVYYFDNNDRSNDNKTPYKPNQQIAIKNVFLPAKSCLIATWLTR